MRITQQDAQNIVNEMKASIHRDVNIMDREGVIVASTNPARRGHLHAGALRVIREGLPSLAIWRDDPAAGIQQGVNLPVALAGELEGVIGVTGDPAEVSMFGDVIKRMTEIMLESLHQREQLDLIDRAKGLFVENWLFAQSRIGGNWNSGAACWACGWTRPMPWRCCGQRSGLGIGRKNWTRCGATFCSAWYAAACRTAGTISAP